jgi:hypothetical protein
VDHDYEQKKCYERSLSLTTHVFRPMRSNAHTRRGFEDPETLGLHLREDIASGILACR